MPETKGMPSRICSVCNGKGFIRSDGAPVNAFEGSDHDISIVCPGCKGTGQTKTGIPDEAELRDIARVSCFRTLDEAVSTLVLVRDRTYDSLRAQLAQSKQVADLTVGMAKRIQELETQLAEAKQAAAATRRKTLEWALKMQSFVSPYGLSDSGPNSEFEQFVALRDELRRAAAEGRDAKA